MKTHTTLTDIRRCVKMHEDGLNAGEISAKLFIDISEIEKIIKAKTKKTPNKKTFDKPKE
jgi:copper homeostasis protein CutC